MIKFTPSIYGGSAKKEFSKSEHFEISKQGQRKNYDQDNSINNIDSWILNGSAKARKPDKRFPLFFKA
jgi:hypothetical protein